MMKGVDVVMPHTDEKIDVKEITSLSIESDHIGDLLCIQRLVHV